MMNSPCAILREDSYIMVRGGCIGSNFNNNIGLECMRMLSEE